MRLVASRPFVCHPTYANPQQAHARPPPDGVPALKCASGEELCLITHDAAIRTGAMTGLLVVSTEAADQLDVLCTCGTVPRTDRLSLSARSSQATA
jgi:hypothetical protein